METIEIKTLIDITNTNRNRPNQGVGLEYDQYRNFTTLMQTIGLRCIITYDNNPVVDNIDIKGIGFGEAYKGKHNVWTFRFRPDRQQAFEDSGGPVGLLIHDMNEIPIIGKLTETINISKAVFYTYESQQKNTLITALLGTS
jgi:hypothetical protein